MTRHTPRARFMRGFIARALSAPSLCMRPSIAILVVLYRAYDGPHDRAGVIYSQLYFLVVKEWGHYLQEPYLFSSSRDAMKKSTGCSLSGGSTSVHLSPSQGTPP